MSVPITYMIDSDDEEDIVCTGHRTRDCVQVKQPIRNALKSENGNESGSLEKGVRGLSVADQDSVHISTLQGQLDKGKKRARDESAPSDFEPKRARSNFRFMGGEDSDCRSDDKAADRGIIWLKHPDTRSTKLSTETTTIKRYGRAEPRTKTYRHGFELGGVHYHVDDAVKVDIVDKAGKPHAKRGLIRSIFSIKWNDEKMKPLNYIHVHFLRTTDEGMPCELFLENCQCQDIPIHISALFDKLDFQLLGADQGRGAAHWFCRYVHAPTHVTYRSLRKVNTPQNCDSCVSKIEHAVQEKHRSIRSGFEVDGVEYHHHDFMFFDDSPNALHAIGQIMEWRNPNIILPQVEGKVARRHSRQELEATVLLFERVDGNYGRKVRHTGRTKVISASQMYGKAFIVDSEAELKSYNPSATFWSEALAQATSSALPMTTDQIWQCLRCMMKAKQGWKDRQACRKACKLPAADYYSGAGGFILPGIGLWDWRSAVDTDSAAYETLKQLEKSLGRFKARRATVQKLYEETLAGQSILPERGSVFLVTGGIPCQGHSGANHHKKVDDPRNQELYIFLAEVDRLRPDYLLLENVPRIMADVTGPGEEGDTRNFAKTAISELLQRGYQARAAVLDSRSYGSPQNRTRFFLLAARAGQPLPDFPSPTHVNPILRATIMPGTEFAPFYPGRREVIGSGRHPAVTIADAISDLPPFSYLPPVPDNARHHRQDPRFNSGRTADGDWTKVGYSDSVKYLGPPLNDYQMKKRRHSGDDVKDHFTSYVTRGQLDMIFDPKSFDSSTDGPLRRAQLNDGFKTLLTSSAPGGKCTGAIHPTQDRKMTIAERKRADGFPDWFILKGSPMQQDSLTGNAVVFEVIEAIYNEIFEKVVVPWWLSAGRPTGDVMKRWREDHPL